MSIKDGSLSFIDRDGHQLVDPLDVDYDGDFGFHLDYLEGPDDYEVHRDGTTNYSYFDHDVWIRKPQ